MVFVVVDAPERIRLVAGSTRVVLESDGATAPPIADVPAVFTVLFGLVVATAGDGPNRLSRSL